MNEIEKLARELYEQQPLVENSDPEETWRGDWEDVKDSYPATYEHFIEEAMNIMGI